MFETADTTEKRRHIEVYVNKRTGEEIPVESEEKLPFNVYILNTERLFREAELRWKEPPAVSVEGKRSLWDRISSFFRVS